MIALFIASEAWLYANSRPLAETSTSPKVSSLYGNTCHVIENALPSSSTRCIAPTTTQPIIH
jgi:hypothetical protein